MDDYIEEYLQERGFEFVESVSMGAGTIDVYFNWRKQAIVTTNNMGVKRLHLEISEEEL